MRVISKKKITEYCQRPENADAALALRRWYHIVKKAQWKCFADLRATFPDADYVANQRVVFNIRGNNHRLVAVVLFLPNLVLIRFIGTHKEYDKIDCSKI